MTNVLTIDLEDWSELAARRFTGELGPSSRRLEQQTQNLLQIVERHGARATFFVVGRTAQENPGVIRELEKAGHEIASHGFDHVPVHRLGREQFRVDALRSKRVLEDISGKAVTGYRAAEFSIGKNEMWALEELSALGFEYDSSIFPIRHRRYGIQGFAPSPSRYDVPNGASIFELPPATFEWMKAVWPMAGGGYFRLLPQRVILARAQKFKSENRPMVTYFHPYEFDNERLQVGVINKSWRARWFSFHQNLGRCTMPAKLTALLERFNFTTCSEFVKGNLLLERRELLSVAG